MEKDVKKAEKANYAFINKWKDRKDYLEDPKVLREALDERNELDEKYGISGKVGYYLGLRNSQDKTNKEIIKKEKQIEKMSLRIINDLEFFGLNISKIPKEKQDLFLKSKLLLPYKHFLEKLFKLSKYFLSEKEEIILNLTSSPAHSNWIEMTSQFLSKEEIIILNEEGRKEKIPFSMVGKFLQSKKQKVRDIASKERIRVEKKWSDVAEHEMNSILEMKRSRDELKGYKRADENRHVNDDISTKTVDKMTSCVENHFELPEKYYQLKAKLLGKDKLSYFERMVPFGKTNTEYTFEEGMGIVKKTFNKLDPEFKGIVEKMQKEGRFDVFPSKGKSSGAFCTHNSRKHPVFILLNFKGNLNSIGTIAHESGHAISNYMMFKEQIEWNCSIPLSIAEVASTFFEDFVLEDVVKDSDDETRLTILIQKLDDDIGSIFRQVACYRFEQELHNEFKKESFLPKEKISEIFRKHMQAYMGEYVSQDKGTEYGWVTWPHIRNFFYVYSYANGLLISKALQKMVREDPKNISKVKKMLSTGSSQSPEEMFKDIGIDITKKEFWETGLKEIEDTYEEAYNLAKKLKKI